MLEKCNHAVELRSTDCQLLVIFNDGEHKMFDDVEVYGHQGDSILFHNMSRRVEHDRL